MHCTHIYYRFKVQKYKIENDASNINQRV